MLADRFQGKRLNSPNDIVCARDGSIWFTDPHVRHPGQVGGRAGRQRDADGGVPDAADGGELQRVIDDLNAPNGLAFSPDEKILYVVESRASRIARSGRTTSAPTARSRTSACSSMRRARVPTTASRSTSAGHVWCGFGCSTGAQSEQLDGVRVYDPDGKAVAQIHLPERCANLCFGGAKNNRLFMAASHSLYALYVNTTGAV